MAAFSFSVWAAECKVSRVGKGFHNDGLDGYGTPLILYQDCSGNYFYNLDKGWSYKQSLIPDSNGARTPDEARRQAEKDGSCLKFDGNRCYPSLDKKSENISGSSSSDNGSGGSDGNSGGGGGNGGSGSGSGGTGSGSGGTGSGGGGIGYVPPSGGQCRLAGGTDDLCPNGVVSIAGGKKACITGRNSNGGLQWGEVIDTESNNYLICDDSCSSGTVQFGISKSGKTVCKRPMTEDKQDDEKDKKDDKESKDGKESDEGGKDEKDGKESQDGRKDGGNSDNAAILKGMGGILDALGQMNKTLGNISRQVGNLEKNGMGKGQGANDGNGKGTVPSNKEGMNNGNGNADNGDDKGKSDKGKDDNKEQESRCKGEDKDTVGCMKKSDLGIDDVSDNGWSDILPKKERKFTFKFDSFLGSERVQCPAPRVLDLRFYKLTLSYKWLCEVLRSIRGIVIMVFSLSGVMFALRSIK